MANDLRNKKVKPLPYDENNRPLAGLCLPIVDGAGNIIGWAPIASSEEGDGTLRIKVDSELEVDSATFNLTNIKVAAIDQSGTPSTLRYIKTDTDGVVQVALATGGGNVNVEKWGGTLQTGADLTPLFQNLDVGLSTRASEATLVSVKTNLDDVKTKLDSLIAKDYATEATLQQVRDFVDTVEVKLQSIIDNIDSLEVNTDDLEAKIQSVRDQLDVLLSTRASEATLSSIDSKLNSLGQKTAVGSVPVVLASDQPAIPSDPSDDTTREIGRVLASEKLYVTESYSPTAVFANARPINGNLNTKNYPRKQIAIVNTGANNARVSVYGSVDDGVNFDVMIQNNVAVNSGNTMLIEETRALTHIRIEARIPGGATTVETRAYALGV